MASSFRKKRIHVIIKGRSGNQLFQYAFARVIQEMTGGELYLDYSEIGFNKKIGKYGPDRHMDNVLDYFTVAPYTYVDEGTAFNGGFFHSIQVLFYRLFRKIYVHFPQHTEQIARFSSGILQRLGIYYQFSTNSFLGYRKPPRFLSCILVRGWFESVAYFDEIQDSLRKELTFSLPLSERLQNLYSVLLEKESVCVTVRRGDFTSNAFKNEFLVCTPDYYLKGASIILQKYPEAILFICSDDVEWCRNNLSFTSSNIIFEPSGLSISDKLHLMTACHHFVLSNSTFSFWAQYIADRPDKMVVAPSVWRRCDPPITEIFMKDWILLDC